ncbi:MAG: hypothetical protein NVS3B21_35570 [Acidimicrobiales bacterium]
MARRIAAQEPAQEISTGPSCVARREEGSPRRPRVAYDIRMEGLHNRLENGGVIAVLLTVTCAPKRVGLDRALRYALDMAY